MGLAGRARTASVWSAAAMAPVRSAQGWTLYPASRELATRYRTAGHWNDQSLGALLDDRLRAHADLELRIWSESRPQRTTIGAVRDLALRMAGGLRAAGVGPDDVVAFQLPNWVEAAATFYGVSLLGAVLVPIVHFYGPKEVRFILAQCGAKALVTAAAFRRNDYLAGLAQYRATLPALRTVAVVGGAPPPGTLSFEELTVGGTARRSRGRRPGRARGGRIHLRHDGRPEGRHPHAPHPRRRGAAARHDAGGAHAAGARRRAGRPRHRDALRAARAAHERAPDPPDRRVGSRARAGGDGRGRRVESAVARPSS